MTAPKSTPWHLSPLARQWAANAGATGISGNQQCVRLQQTGQIRNDKGGRWMRLTARQTIALDRCAFDWRAKLAPLGIISVVDRLGETGGALQVKALGIVPIVTMPQSVELTRGEAIRFLGELPWAPDAILANHDLRWADTAAGDIAVSWGDIAITLSLNAQGLVDQVFAPDRPRAVKTGFEPTPWRGTYSNFRQIGGRTIPMKASASWKIDGIEEIYGNFELTDWQLAR